MSHDVGTRAAVVRPDPTGPAAWAGRALCAQADATLFFGDASTWQRARRICHDCPVRLPCLAEALDARIDHGVWGGLTERERRALLRARPGVRSWRRLLVTARPGSEHDDA
ncbi:MAG: WhiB family transcriptional regulator [Kineosporiaceae bacterium]